MFSDSVSCPQVISFLLLLLLLLLVSIRGREAIWSDRFGGGTADSESSGSSWWTLGASQWLSDVMTPRHGSIDDDDDDNDDEFDIIHRRRGRDNLSVCLTIVVQLSLRDWLRRIDLFTTIDLSQSLKELITHSLCGLYLCMYATADRRQNRNRQAQYVLSLIESGF